MKHSHAPRGARGLKLPDDPVDRFAPRHAPRGARGLKHHARNFKCAAEASRPARGAWIETAESYRDRGGVVSRPARGAWIETRHKRNRSSRAASRPARGAWIETRDIWAYYYTLKVTPRAGRVD